MEKSNTQSISILLGFLISLFFLVSPVEGATVKINDLIENAKAYAEKNVVIEGEVIGEPIGRGDYVWVNIHDGSNAIGVYIEREALSAVKYWGNYKYKGDQVKVTGIFHQVYEEQGGEMGIEGTTLEVIQEGYVATHILSPWRVVAIFLLVPTAGVLIGINYKKRRDTLS
ncbi:MAG: hypothetical protein ACRDDX_14630 [Cellulosilyticaceae bacterium]